MHIYYIAGVPYSDELYHHGIKDQKWGLRRFQNPDGSLTALGKLRYGAQKTGESIKNTIKKARDTRTERYKKAHPSAMSDEELSNALKRLDMEKKYLQVREEVRNNSGTNFRVKNMIKRSLEKGGETLLSKVFEVAGNKIVSQQRLKDDKKYSKKMAKRYAKNKLLSDRIVDRGQRRQTRNDASSKFARDLQKNYKTMSFADIQNAGKTYEVLKKIENRYRGTNLTAGKKGG